MTNQAWQRWLGADNKNKSNSLFKELVLFEDREHFWLYEKFAKH